jgi:hypothetical protein
VNQLSRVRFPPVQPIVGSSVNGRPERSERSSDCSAVTRYHLLASFNWTGYSATNRETWGFESLREHQFTGPSSNGKGTVLRRLKFRFESGRINHEPVADRDATDCLSVPCGFESRPARQHFWGSGQDGLSHRIFTARIAGSNPAYPANARRRKSSGPKHRRRCTLLLPARL